jgi:hypothetical protein
MSGDRPTTARPRPREQRRLLPLAALLLAILLPALALGAFALPAAPAWAGPVEWQEVPHSGEDRQWWDAGSLRIGRNGRLRVLSRFLEAGEKPISRLYVMELDCDQDLYRDVSVNGLPRPRAEWHPVAGDELTAATVRAACRAGSPLLAEARHG